MHIKLDQILCLYSFYDYLCMFELEFDQSFLHCAMMFNHFLRSTNWFDTMFKVLWNAIQFFSSIVLEQLQLTIYPVLVCLKKRKTSVKTRSNRQQPRYVSDFTSSLGIPSHSLAKDPERVQLAILLAPHRSHTLALVPRSSHLPTRPPPIEPSCRSPWPNMADLHSLLKFAQTVP